MSPSASASGLHCWPPACCLAALLSTSSRLTGGRGAPSVAAAAAASSCACCCSSACCWCCWCWSCADTSRLPFQPSENVSCADTAAGHIRHTAATSRQRRPLLDICNGEEDGCQTGLLRSARTDRRHEPDQIGTVWSADNYRQYTMHIHTLFR